ncbi:MAG: Crp/Fnr family transcriptional regulator [Dehalococcoidales bacterium]
MAIDVGLLKSTAYFSGMDSAVLESIKSLIQETHVQKGAHFLSEGESSDYLYFIVSGLVKVYKTSSGGKEQVLHIAPPGDSLNDVSLFDGGPTAAGMVAMTPAVLYAIRKDDIIELLWKNPPIMMNVIKSLAQRIRRDSNLVEDLSSTQVLQRLAKLFIGRYGGEEITVGLTLTQKDMAGLVGSSREMVNRSLKVLEDSGGIRLSRRRIIVLDKEVLCRIAGNSTDMTEY